MAYAGREHGVAVTIVVPEGNSPDKNASMAGFGAELLVHGRDFQEALEHAMALADHLGVVLVPSFQPRPGRRVPPGAAELHTQAGHLDVVYVPVGLGSGICAHMAVRDRVAGSCSGIPRRSASGDRPGAKEGAAANPGRRQAVALMLSWRHLNPG